MHTKKLDNLENEPFYSMILDWKKLENNNTFSPYGMEKEKWPNGSSYAFAEFFV